MDDSLTATIISEYEKTLNIPKNPPEKQFLLCPVGLIGSGKTTTMRALSKKLSLVRISNDDVRKIIHDNYKSLVDTEGFTHIISTLFKKYLSLGYSIAADGDCASEKAQALISERQKEFNTKVIWIHINTPEEFIIKNLLQDRRTWLFANGEEAVKNYMKRKEIHQNLPMPFIYTFDMSLGTFDTQVDEATELIKREVGSM
mgnify:FL=1